MEGRTSLLRAVEREPDWPNRVRPASASRDAHGAGRARVVPEGGSSCLPRSELRGRAPLEAPPLHLAPTAPAPDEVEEGLDLEEAERLTIDEVLDDAVDDKPGEVDPARISAEGDLLEEDGGDGQKDAHQHGEHEEENQELGVEDAQPPGQRDRDVAGQLDERAQHLEQHEVGEGEQTD